MMSNYKEMLLGEVLGSLNDNYDDNYDEIQRGKEVHDESQTFLAALLNRFLPLSKQFQTKHPVKFKLKDLFFKKEFYASVVDRLINFSFLYEALADAKSKTLLLKIIAYRILGYKKVKLPRNTPLYWQTISDLNKLIVPGSELYTKHYTLNLFNLDQIGVKTKLNATAPGIAAAYLQEQYAYHGQNVECRAESGDVVIDAGACWGDTTLYFAHQVGEAGKVYAFEFMPGNLEIFNHNIQQNQHLAGQIELVKHPLWHESDKEMYCFDHGPGSSISDSSQGQSNYLICKTITIDDFVMRHELSKVDFIKMDIEGAELSALRGALATIKKFKPKLAISVYHKDDDFDKIPRFILEANPEYKLYLEHHTIHDWETVLFALPT
jgi:FkbM family methyltransferase